MRETDLLRSNPVLAIERLIAGLVDDPVAWTASARILDPVVDGILQRGQRLPPARLKRWSEEGLLSPRLVLTAAGPVTGVVGLAVDPGSGVGFVVPLEVTASDAWWIASQLPIAEGRTVELLARLIGDASAGVAGALPERLAFRVDSPFPRSCSGRSMDLAAAVAVLLSTVPARRPDGVACVLVEPAGEGFAAVEGVDAKLGAFERELGSGGLLVRHTECPSRGCWDSRFAEVWTVAARSELSAAMLRAGWFEAVLSIEPLGADEAARIEAHLDRLVDAHDHRAAIGLAERLLAAPWNEDVPRTARLRVLRHRLVSLRHVGRAREALELAESLREETRALRDAVSHDDAARADLEYAAGLFDPGRFAELLEVLEPWCARIDADPRLLPAETRVAIWNTVARAWIATSAAGWEDLLESSKALQSTCDPTSSARTGNYLIEGLLRCGRLDQAEIAIANNDKVVPANDAFSRRMMAVYRADLARRSGTTWSDAAMDDAPIGDDAPAHPIGLYELAVARQRGRPKEDVRRRLCRAREAFDADRTPGDDPGPLGLLAAIARLGEAEAGGDVRACHRARADLLAVTDRSPISVEVVRALEHAIGGEAVFDRVCDVLPWG